MTTSFTARKLTAAPWIELYKRVDQSPPVRMSFRPKFLAKPDIMKFSKTGTKLAVVNGLKSVDVPTDDLNLMTITGERFWSRREDFMIVGGNTSAANKPRLYERFGTAMRNDPTSALVPATGVYITKAAFSADSKYVAVVYSNAQTVIQIFKYGYNGFEHLTNLTALAAVTVLQFEAFGPGEDILVASGAAVNTGSFWRRTSNASVIDPDSFLALSVPALSNRRVLGIDKSGQMVFVQRPVVRSINAVNYNGFAIEAWTYDTNALTVAVNGDRIGFPPGFDGAGTGPGFILSGAVRQFVLSPDGRTVVITQDSLKTPVVGWQLSMSSIVTFSLYAGTSAPNVGKTLANYFGAPTETTGSANGLTTTSITEYISDVRFAPDGLTMIYALGKTYSYNPTSGGTVTTLSSFIRHWTRDDLTPTSRWTMRQIVNNPSSYVVYDIFALYPNFVSPVNEQFFEVKIPTVAAKTLQRLSDPLNNPLGLFAVFPFAPTVAGNTVTEITFSPTAKYVIFKTATGGYQLWRKDASWTDATKVVGTFVTVMTGAGNAFEEAGYFVLPEKTVVTDLVWSDLGDALAFHATNPDTPVAVNGRYVFDTGMTMVQRGRQTDAEMTASRMAFAPNDPLAFFAATYNNFPITDSEVELYKFEAGRVSYSKKDTEHSLYGPVSFSNCSDVVVAHGLLDAPFSFFKREGDLLIEQIPPDMDWAGYGEIIDIEFLPDCSGFVVITPDKIVVVETGEELVPDPNNPEGPEILVPTVEVKSEFPLESSANDGTGGDGKSQPGDPLAVLVVQVIDPTTGKPVISIIVEKVDAVDTNSANTRPDTPGIPPLPLPPGAVKKKEDLFFDLTPDKELVDRNNRFYVSVNVGFQA